MAGNTRRDGSRSKGARVYRLASFALLVVCANDYDLFFSECVCFPHEQLFRTGGPPPDDDSCVCWLRDDADDDGYDSVSIIHTRLFHQHIGGGEEF